MTIRLYAAAALLTIACFAWAGEEQAPKQWPAVLLIDDFENGLTKWKNEDTGALELVDDAPQGKKALRWTAADDGIGRIVYQGLDRSKIDFSEYDLLKFRFKVEGKLHWCVDPIIQQHPHAYGYRAHYYAIDTMEGFGEWITYVQDLQKWENAWPDSFEAEKQEFAFEISQLAGAGHTRVYLDEIMLVKNALGLDRSYRGQWAAGSDGSQLTHFRIAVRNSAEAVQTVRASIEKGSLKKLQATVPTDPLRLPPGGQGELNVYVIAPADVVRSAPAFYGETARLRVTVDELPQLELFAELPAGIRPAKPQHPVILTSPERQAELRRQWKDPETRRKMPHLFRRLVAFADKALETEPEYPPLAHGGQTTCPVDGQKLAEIEVPNLPMSRYQCRECGRIYSGPFFDAGMKGWCGKHRRNAATVLDLGVAYGITGERRYAQRAAEILKAYVDVYPKLPIAAPSAGSPAYSATSGAVRIGGSYMSERVWLRGLAVGLDFIREAKVLSPDEVRDILEKVFAPSANLMMDHKVGVMNLQWMIQSAGLYAGLATDDPALVARAVYDSHGVTHLVRLGYLADGNWWENPSYQNVANGVAFPVLATLINAGIMPFDARLNTILKAAYRLYGPNGLSPTLGTGGPGGFGYTDNMIHSIAHLIDDPQLAWVAHNRRLWAATSGGGRPYESYLWAEMHRRPPKLPKEKTQPILPTGTTHAVDYGGVSLRMKGSDAYCYLHYGRHLTHGHFNRLSINAYGKGGWYVRNVMGGYGFRFKEYLEPTSGSSTIMVDGQNQDADTGELLFLKSAPLAELASAREVGAWKDVEHERSVALTKDFLVVLDRCVSSNEHTYDWLSHTSFTRLSWEKGAEPKGAVTSLGEAECYKFFLPAEELSLTSPPPHALYRGDGRRHKGAAAYHFAATQENQAQLFRTRNEMPNKRQHEGLILRKRGKTVRFICVMEPLAKDESPAVQVKPLEIISEAGKALGLEAGQAVQVTKDKTSLVVVVNYSGAAIRVKAFPKIVATERVTVAKP